MLLTDRMRDLLDRVHRAGLDISLKNQFLLAGSPVDVKALRGVFISEEADGFSGERILVRKGTIAELRWALEIKAAIDVARERFIGCEVWAPDAGAAPGIMVDIDNAGRLIGEFPGRKRATIRAICHVGSSLLVRQQTVQQTVTEPKANAGAGGRSQSRANDGEGVRQAFLLVSALGASLDLECGVLVMTAPAITLQEMRATVAKQICLNMTSMREVLVRREILAHCSDVREFLCWSPESGLREIYEACETGLYAKQLNDGVASGNGQLVNPADVIVFREQKSVLRRAAAACGSVLGL